MKGKNQRIYIRVTPKEKACIQKRMEDMGVENMSAFMLKMALNGYCVKLDLKDLKELLFLLRMCSNNLNQYAKKANETGTIYQRDIVDLRASFTQYPFRAIFNINADMFSTPISSILF